MRGLWDNIHAKRKRIKAGSGEKMRKPGSKGSPTNKALIKSKRKVDNKNAKSSMEEGGVVFNKPKRTPDHPKKSHVVIVRKPGGGKKTIRFGEQGASTAGKPKEGESDKMKMKRKSFKSRHGKNIARGPQSAAYWADKVKWEEGGVNKDRKFFIGGLMSKIASINPLVMGVKALKEKKKNKGGNSGDGSPDGAHVHSHQGGGKSEAEGAVNEATEAVEGGAEEEKAPVGVMKKGGIAPKKENTMEDDFLFAAGVIKGDKEAQRKVKKQLYASEEATYRSVNRKPPKRNIFKNGGVLSKKKKNRKFKILNTQEELDKIQKDYEKQHAIQFPPKKKLTDKEKRAKQVPDYLNLKNK